MASGPGPRSSKDAIFAAFEPARLEVAHRERQLGKRRVRLDREQPPGQDARRIGLPARQLRDKSAAQQVRPEGSRPEGIVHVAGGGVEIALSERVVAGEVAAELMPGRAGGALPAFAAATCTGAPGAWAPGRIRWRAASASRHPERQHEADGWKNVSTAGLRQRGATSGLPASGLPRTSGRPHSILRPDAAFAQALHEPFAASRASKLWAGCKAPTGLRPNAPVEARISHPSHRQHPRPSARLTGADSEPRSIHGNIPAASPATRDPNRPAVGLPGHPVYMLG